MKVLVRVGCGVGRWLGERGRDRKGAGGGVVLSAEDWMDGGREVGEYGSVGNRKGGNE